MRDGGNLGLFSSHYFIVFRFVLFCFRYFFLSIIIVLL